MKTWNAELKSLCVPRADAEDLCKFSTGSMLMPMLKMMMMMVMMMMMMILTVILIITVVVIIMAMTTMRHSKAQRCLGKCRSRPQTDVVLLNHEMRATTRTVSASIPQANPSSKMRRDSDATSQKPFHAADAGFGFLSANCARSFPDSVASVWPTENKLCLCAANSRFAKLSAEMLSTDSFFKDSPTAPSSMLTTSYRAVVPEPLAWGIVMTRHQILEWRSHTTTAARPAHTYSHMFV